MWPITFDQAFMLAEKYRFYGQWRDAAVEYRKAFDCAKTREWRELCAWEGVAMLERAERIGRFPPEVNGSW